MKYLLSRREKLENYLKEALKYRTIMNSADMQFFLIDTNDDTASFVATNSMNMVRSTSNQVIQTINRTVDRAVSFRSIPLSPGNAKQEGGSMETLDQIESDDDDFEDVREIKDEDLEDVMSDRAHAKPSARKRHCVIA